MTGCNYRRKYIRLNRQRFTRFLGSKLLGYSLSMRLRHRDAAHRGYLNYQQRTAEAKFA